MKPPGGQSAKEAVKEQTGVAIKRAPSFLFGAKGAFGLSVSMLCILSLPKLHIIE